jgi:hypothetical protein
MHLPIANMEQKINYRNSVNRAIIKKKVRGIKMTDLISWVKVMGTKVISIDGEDIGKVENVNTYSIEVKDGLLAKRHYYLPKYSIKGFDGRNNLITFMTKQEIKNKFAADNPVAELWKAPRP